MGTRILLNAIFWAFLALSAVEIPTSIRAQDNCSPLLPEIASDQVYVFRLQKARPNQKSDWTLPHIFSDDCHVLSLSKPSREARLSSTASGQGELCVDDKLTMMVSQPNGTEEKYVHQFLVGDYNPKTGEAKVIVQCRLEPVIFPAAYFPDTGRYMVRVVLEDVYGVEYRNSDIYLSVFLRGPNGPPIWLIVLMSIILFILLGATPFVWPHIHAMVSTSDERRDEERDDELGRRRRV